MLKHLHLNWVSLDRRDNPAVSGKFLDYSISGQSLKDYLVMSKDSHVTPFGWFPNRKAQHTALKLLRLQSKSELIDNRVELYICAACGSASLCQCKVASFSPCRLFESGLIINKSEQEVAYISY